jgi:hypothetical protein
MKAFFLWSSLVLLFLLGLLCLRLELNLRADYVIYLKQARTETNLAEAEQALINVTRYFEHRQFTSGNTGIIFRTQADDLEQWHERLLDAQETALRLEFNEPNALLKIQEGLNSPPAHLEWYPYQKFITLGWSIAVVFLALGLILPKPRRKRNLINPNRWPGPRLHYER